MTEEEIRKTIEEVEVEDREKRERQNNNVWIRVEPWQTLDNFLNDITHQQTNGNYIHKTRERRLNVVLFVEGLNKGYELIDKYNLCLADIAPLMKTYDIAIRFEGLSNTQNEVIENLLKIQSIGYDQETALKILEISAIRGRIYHER